MPIMQLRTADDAYPLADLDYGRIDTGTTSVSLGLRLWNDKPVAVTGELLGTGDGSRTSFAAAFRPFVNHANAPVAVKVDGTPATGFTVDHAGGLILFNQAPPAGKLVVADYAYSVGSIDSSAVVLTVQQVKQFAGDGGTRSFPLPSRCLTPLKLLVAGVEIPSTGYELRDGGMTLYLNDPPPANTTAQFSYADPVCQGGYYEIRSSGVDNPYAQTGMTDDAQSAFYKLGGVFSFTNRLVGTGDGTKTSFDLGGVLVRSVTKVKVGGADVTGYSLNHVTGTLVFQSPPSSGAEVRVDYSHERGHRIGNIRQWCGRRLFLRASIPYDAPNAVLSARLRVVSQ